MEATPATHLLLDCAFAGLTVALAQQNNDKIEILSQKTSSLARNSDDLAPALQHLLATTASRAENLTHVFVTVGPGSFTGCRLGLAVAEALKLLSPTLTITGLSTLQAAAVQAVAEGSIEAPFEVWLDAAGRQVFRRVFGAGGAPCTAAECLPLEEALALRESRPVVAQSTLMLNIPHIPLEGLTPATLARCAEISAYALPPQPVYIKPLTYRKAEAHSQIEVLSTLPEGAVARWQNTLMSAAEVAAQLAQKHHALLWHPSGAHLLLATSPGAVADVLTLWTPETERRKGHAAALLAFAKAMAQKAGCTAVTLEVRAGNAAAVAAYTHQGFQQVAVRKGYYGAEGTLPPEDALVLSLNLQ